MKHNKSFAVGTLLAATLAVGGALQGNGLDFVEICYGSFAPNCPLNLTGYLPAKALEMAQAGASNPEINPSATLGKAEIIRWIKKDNPAKLPLAIAGILLSGAGYIFARRSRKDSILLAPQDRADYEYASFDAKADLESQMALAKGRARIVTATRLGHLSPAEIQVLQACITPQEYFEYGWALDSGDNAWKMELLRQSGFEGGINLEQLANAPIEYFMPSEHQQAQLEPATIPATPQQLEELRQHGLKSIQALVDHADASKLGGCVIVAAPGGGKTTYLGTAWGRLRNIYGTRLKTLAVVVKPTDVKAFSAIADKCLCVTDSPRDTAVAILKFIKASITNHGEVRRLFLDDFLTMNKKFNAALKGLWINPNTYEVTTSRGDDTEAQNLIETLETELNNGWLVGREYNSAVWVSSHSPNMDTLPFVGSRDSRSVGQLVFLCKSDKKDFIEQALNNPNLVPSNSRRALLKQTLDSLSDIGEERIVLSSTDNWTLGLIPQSVNQEYQTYKILWESSNPTITEGIKPVKVDAFDAEYQEIKLSPTAQKVYDYLKSNGTRTVNQIKNAKRLSVDDIRFAINELTSLELIIHEGDDTYSAL